MAHRRKLPKDLPKLPSTAFSPPSSSDVDAFPIPGPNALQPAQVVDANVVSNDINYSQWKKEAGQNLSSKIRGVVLSLPASEIPAALKELNSSSKESQILSIITPFNLEAPDKAVEELLTSSATLSLSTVFNKSSPDSIKGLHWALSRSRPVDIDIQATLSESLLEGFEDLITGASVDIETLPPIILSNILPPPHDLDLPIVKLMSHPEYLAFQSRIAVLSLFPNIYVKFLPPSWDAPTPQTPYPGSPIESIDVQQQREWKRRIKMYLGPVMEAFGYERIIFGSSPSSSSRGRAHVGNWFDIARESLAELGIEQASVDAVFFDNAQKVYGKK